MLSGSGTGAPITATGAPTAASTCSAPGGTGRTCVARPHPVSTSAGAGGQGKRTVVESSGLLAGRVQRTALPGYASDCAQAD